MFESATELEDWFKGNKSKTLQIEKDEDGVCDSTTLRLSDVVLIQHHDIDDYLSDHAFLLKGEGIVQAENGIETLPYAFFEIALTEQWSARIKRRFFQLVNLSTTSIQLLFSIFLLSPQNPCNGQCAACE